MKNQKTKSISPCLTVYMGKFSIIPVRRAAYEKAAGKSGFSKSLCGWARNILDHAAGFDETEKRNGK